MATEILQKVGTQIRFFVTGSFNPADDGTNWTIGAPTDVVLTLVGVADGAARQSTKVDLGEKRAAAYEVLGCVEYAGGGAATVGATVDYYWAPSTSSTAGNGNVAGNSGIDDDAPGGAVGPPLIAEFLKVCVFIGSLVVHDGTDIAQSGFVGVLWPTSRYGQLIIMNNGGDALAADDVEMHQVFNPIVDESQ